MGGVRSRSAAVRGEVLDVGLRVALQRDLDLVEPRAVGSGDVDLPRKGIERGVDLSLAVVVQQDLDVGAAMVGYLPGVGRYAPGGRGDGRGVRHLVCSFWETR